MESSPALVAVVLIVALVALAVAMWWLAARAGPREVAGGAGPRPRRDPIVQSPRYAGVVVDTLNMFHWANTTAKRVARPSLERIVALIDRATPLLRKNGYGGPITYALKGPGGEPRLGEKAFDEYREAAERNGVTVLVATPDPSAEKRAFGGPEQHAARGRDDFLAIVTAARDRLPILTEDRYRDFGAMKSGGLRPFFVTKFEPGRPPRRSHVTPAAGDFKRVRKPRRIPLARALPQMQP